MPRAVPVLLVASLLLVAGCGKRSDVAPPEGSEEGWGAPQQYPLPEKALEPQPSET